LIRTRTPPLSAISIDPAADLSTAGFASIVGSEITTASGTIWTGTNPAGGTDDGGAMAVNRRRHLNSMLAFTSCWRATNATEAPGSSVAATNSCFNASGQRRRLPPACLVSASR
jgi:hypothetical protein